MGAAARARCLLAAWLLAAVAGSASAQGDPACSTEPFVLAPGADHVTLAHGFVRDGTDSVWTRRGGLRRDRDYVLDRLRGELRLLASTAPGETLWVATCWLVAPPPLDYARQRYRPLPLVAPSEAAADSGARATSRPSTGRDIANVPGGSSLSVTGNKTVAIEFGSSQDAALRQSLDLAVGGMLAPGVELTGVLSDRNTPLTAAGSTQDLQALDRVLIQVKAPNATASLGDVPLSVNLGEFARLDRQVQGMSGTWKQGGFEAMVAAASATGEYNRLQFNGSDGLQGPYLLTDRDGGTGVSVVAGSEIVTLDGQRMSRGESADYSMDYDRARVTFTNRRPITAASRITVEYQYALNRYRRNIAVFSAQWRMGRNRLFASATTETDDPGRPLSTTLSTSDLQVLASAGDSATRAIATGLVAGLGDYDTVRVGHDSLVVAFAGPDSGTFAASFARVAPGHGDYLDSAVVAGRTAYHWVGPGFGTFVLGRALPLPESHQLVSMGGAVAAGPLTLEAEGAVSRFDANTLSSIDDANDAGGAGRVGLTLEGRAGPLPGRTGVQLSERDVERGFTPFTRLERAFAEQDWGLPDGADLEHPRRTDAAAYWRLTEGRELRGTWARLQTPDGFLGTRHGAEFTWTGAARTHVTWLEADGRLAGVRFADGGRRHLLADLVRAGRWLTPSVHLELDDRRTPSDSARTRARVQDLSGDLSSGSALHWKTSVGLGARLDRTGVDAGLTSVRATTYRAAAESTPGGPLGVGFTGQHRVTHDELTGSDAQSDLASMRLRGERRRWGLSGQLDVELTREADNERQRTLTYVGSGKGTYDALGNFVGTGDYDLVLVVSPVLQRFARVATSARSAWQFGSSDAWRGSRFEFSLEDEARRPDAPRFGDVFLSTGLALVDPDLSLGTIAQRIEGDLAPGSHVAAFHVRVERRVNADRSYANFAQTTDQRTGSLRWRTRPAPQWTLESTAQVQWQNASEEVPGVSGYSRTLVDQSLVSQLAMQARAALRATGALELDQSRPLGQTDATRTVRIGPDISAGLGARGHLDVSLRRAFVSGPAAVSLLPSADPAGFARCDGSARFDLRLHETTTFGVSGTVR